MDKTKFRKNIFIILSYIVLLTMLPITLLFSKLVGDKMTNHIYQTMQEAASMCADIIERQYSGDMLMLEGLSVRMATTLEEDPSRGVQRMISTAERYGMKRIAYSAPDGSTLATDEADMNLKGVDNFERALAGERLLTNVITDVVDGERVNI